EGGEKFPTDENGKTLYSDVDYIETWPAMEEAGEAVLSGSIGVSNLARIKLNVFFQIAKIVPANNQVECHPYLNQKKLIDYCKSKGITVHCLQPLGSPDSFFSGERHLTTLLNLILPPMSSSSF
ncbi:aldo-keto reductase family 1 member B1-like, partial [Penaeus monodon]|uniref:aldo-keto reductase family 1 member B1-like n=1 Tax=Penaeus monodon TaxID=6687 RepID=UPI0018A75469